MKPRVYNLIHLVAAIVLLASLGLSAAPGKTASFACDPTFVRRNGKVFTVLPSGGDDTANLTCAFEAAKAAGKGTVHLVKGDYRTGMIDVKDFDGYFVGAGMGKTVILPAHQMDCAGQAAINNMLSLFTFRLGNPRISDMTFFIDDPETCALFEAMPGWFRYSIESIILFTGSEIGGEDPCNHLKDEIGNGSVNRVEIMTPPGVEQKFDYYVIRPVYFSPGFVSSDPNCMYWQSFLGGNYSVTNSVFSLPAIGVTTNLMKGRVMISNNTFNQPATGIETYDVEGTRVTIRDNQFAQPYFNGIGIFASQWETWDDQPNFVIPTSFLVHNNTFTVDNYANGIFMADYANLTYAENRAKGVITNNRITLDGADAWGIDVEAVKDVLVMGNIVKGRGNAGILLNGWGRSATPSATLENGSLLGNILSGFEIYDSATGISPIYLGPQTLRCTVVGKNVNDTVLDEGVDNRLIGVKRLQQLSIQSLMRDKREMGKEGRRVR